MTESKEKKQFDWIEEYPHQYIFDETPQILKTTKNVCICISGIWHTDITKEFTDAIQALSWIAFALKFKMKRKNPDGYYDYTMPPAESFRTNIDKPKEERNRKAVLRQPDFIWADDVLKMRRIAHAKSKDTKLPQIDFETLNSQKVIQIGHFGPYTEMNDTIAKIHKFAKEKKLTLVWPHHEIYLNDLRRTKPAELKTIVRYVVK